jgi:hypothetical protein
MCAAAAKIAPIARQLDLQEVSSSRSDISGMLRNLGQIQLFPSSQWSADSSQAHKSKLFLSTAAQVLDWLSDCNLLRRDSGRNWLCKDEKADVSANWTQAGGASIRIPRFRRRLPRAHKFPPRRKVSRAKR